jgi:HEAT repeat protein
VDALGNIGDQKALDPLSVLLHDKDECVRRATEEAIRKINSKNK